MPITAIHKCSGDPPKWRIGRGECKFTSKQTAINAFEKWIKTKSKQDYKELEQHQDMVSFAIDCMDWFDDPDVGTLLKEHKSEFTIRDLGDIINKNK